MLVMMLMICVVVGGGWLWGGCPALLPPSCKD
jgi:hypothetical protein